ncbi:MAG TPA: hypothetical protein VE987_10000 [Polyangiaceae bacterium]|nr:hypothetical protein [Polyangiaceae bacterium]
MTTEVAHRLSALFLLACVSALPACSGGSGAAGPEPGSSTDTVETDGGDGGSRDAGGDAGGGDAGGDAGSGDAGSGALGFAQDVYPLLTATCSGCHGIGNFQLGVSATAAYAALVNQPIPGGVPCATATLPAGTKLVVPSDSGHSLLYNKVASAEPMGPAVLCGVSMPYGGGMLPQSQVTTIKDWIDQGAKP